MLLTPLTFLDDIERFIVDGWKPAGKAANNGEPIELRFFQRTYRNNPPGDQPWARVSWRVADTETTFGGTGERIKTRTGTIVVEHYFPQAVSQGSALLIKMSMVAEKTFDGWPTE